MSADRRSPTLPRVVAPEPELPEASVPGLRFRHYAGPDDHTGIADVMTAVWTAGGDEAAQTAAQVANEYAHPVNFDPWSDLLLAELEGRIVAVGRVSWTDQTDGHRAFELRGYVDPAARRRGIGRAMLRWNEARALVVAAGLPDDRPAVFQVFASDADVGGGTLYAAEGYTPVRWFFDMVRPDLEDLPAVVVPDGIAIRPGRPEDARAVFDAGAEAFADHWGDNEHGETAYEEWRNEPEFDPPLWRIAWADEEIAGYVQNTIYPADNERFGMRRGWLDSVAVRRPWRRRGVATALIAASLRALRDAGMTSAALGVDADNPSGALRLYERAGFRTRVRVTVQRKPFGAEPAR